MFAAIAVLWAVASAAQDWLVVNGIVAHLEGTYCNNRITKGLGLERADGAWRYAIGVYDNSNCRWSTYVAAAWLPVRLAENVRLGVIGGGVTGYKSSVTPAGGLVLAYEGERYGLNLIGIPPLSDGSPGVLWLQAKRRW